MRTEYFSYIINIYFNPTEVEWEFDAHVYTVCLDYSKGGISYILKSIHLFTFYVKLSINRCVASLKDDVSK